MSYSRSSKNNIKSIPIIWLESNGNIKDQESKVNNICYLCLGYIQLEEDYSIVASTKVSGKIVSLSLNSDQSLLTSMATSHFQKDESTHLNGSSILFYESSSLECLEKYSSPSSVMVSPSVDGYHLSLSPGIYPPSVGDANITCQNYYTLIHQTSADENPRCVVIATYRFYKNEDSTPGKKISSQPVGYLSIDYDIKGGIPSTLFHRSVTLPLHFSEETEENALVLLLPDNHLVLISWIMTSTSLNLSKRVLKLHLLSRTNISDVIESQSVISLVTEKNFVVLSVANMGLLIFEIAVNDAHLNGLADENTTIQVNRDYIFLSIGMY